MLNTAQSPWPSYSEEEIDEVAAVLRSNRVNQWTGDQIKLFEREFAEWCGVEHAIAVSNGTLALDLALKCLDIGPGDEVIVTPRTFIASVSSVITAGARPVFADVDPDSGNITAATIPQVVNERTKAVIPVHLAGWPVDVPELTTKLAGTGIAVIEDCAQAHGAQVDGQSVGSLGTIGAWSFCQDKIMTTGGEGGMVTCDDAGLWDRMWSYKDHGKNWDAVFNRAHAPGFRWVHDSFGTNWRMLEMQAAIGRIQLRRMKQWTARRTAIATRYAEALAPFASALRVPLPRPGLVHGFYRLYAYVRADGLKPGWSRDRIVEEVTRLGVPLYQGSCSEVYLEKAFEGTDFRPAQRLPAALGLGASSLMFLVHPSLRDDEVEHACQVFAQVLEAATR